MAEEVFIRRASGLVRVVSPVDALVYAFVNPTIPYAYHYIIWSQVLYPGANIYIAALFIACLYPIVACIALLTIAMPRSGGEYMFGSRVLHPYIGLLCSWGMILGGGLNWSGCLCSWGTMWGVGSAIWMEGMRRGAENLINLGLFLQNPYTWTGYWIGLIQLVAAFFVMWLGTKWVMRCQWFVMIVTWVMLGCYMYICFTSSPAEVAVRMAKYGLDYNYVLERAREVGWTPGLTSWSATVMAGYTYLQLSTLGSTYVSAIAGEIKEIRKAQFLAQFGSLAMFIVYWELFTWATYTGLGRDLIAAIAYLNAAGLDLEVWGTNCSPVCYLLTLYLTDNPILMQLAGPVGMFIINWGGILGLGFGPVRYLFAYGFDGVLPHWVCAVDKRGHAWGSVLLGFIMAFIIHTLNTFTPWLAYIAHTIAVWFISWTIMGIVAAVFPYRRRDIFERSPAVVKKMVGPVPLITILGIIAAAFSAYSVYSILYPALTGAAVALQLVYLGWTIVALIVAPSIVFWAFYLYRKYVQGIPMELRFKEIPPD